MNSGGVTANRGRPSSRANLIVCIAPPSISVLTARRRGNGPPAADPFRCATLRISRTRREERRHRAARRDDGASSSRVRADRSPRIRNPRTPPSERPAASAPRCAAASIPGASPETTGSPRTKRQLISKIGGLRRRRPASHDGDAALRDVPSHVERHPSLNVGSVERCRLRGIRAGAAFE